jgi:hypothetical protein
MDDAITLSLNLRNGVVKIPYPGTANEQELDFDRNVLRCVENFIRNSR